MKYEKLWQNVIKRRFSEEAQDRLYLKDWLTYSGGTDRADGLLLR